jgi:heat shock protein HtpX
MVFRAVGVSLFLIALSTLVGAFAGLILAGLLGLVFLAIALFALSAIFLALVWLYSPAIILRKYGAKPSENKELNKMVEDMAVNAKIPVPRVFIMPIEPPNAFAVGRGKKAAVCVTEGLLSLNKGEIESVVAHQVWHIYNGDTPVQQTVSVIAWIFRLTVILIPLAVFIVKLGLSDRIEYRADYYAARLAKKPGDMASAIAKMSDTARKNPMKGSPAFESIWTVNPFRREGVRRWFYTHPPTARRKKRLDDMIHEGTPESYEGTEDIEFIDRH